MKPRLDLLTKLLVLVSLILASMPSGATETVCVVGSKKQVVAMRKCGMPCCAHKVQPPAAKASCCKPKAAARQEVCGAAGLNCHCETRHVATSMPGQVAAVKFALAKFEIGLPGAPLHSVLLSDSISVWEDAVRGADVDPPRKVPRTPVRGRAPPAAID